MTATINAEGEVLRQRRLGEKSLAVWRVIASCPKGASHSMIHPRVRGQLDGESLTFALQSLRDAGYTSFTGFNRWGVWHITDKVPLGEELPLWKVERTAAVDEGADDDKPAAAPAPAGRPEGAVASVFELGSTVGDVSRLTETPPAEAPKAPAEALSPLDLASWKQPSKAAPAQPDTSERRRHNFAIKPEAQPAATKRIVSPRRGEPVFALDSKGVLTIDDGSYEVVKLEPECTRALFRWLDRLSGLDLVAMVQEGPRA